MPTERLSTRLSPKARATARLERVLPFVADATEAASLAPSPGDTESDALDKLHGALSASAGATGKNVRAFGAEGDGVTDDTNAVQRALDEASENETELFFPAGDYRLTAQIEVGSNTTLRFAPGAWLVRDYASAGGYTNSLVRNSGFVTPTTPSTQTSVPAYNSNIRIFGMNIRAMDSSKTGAALVFLGVHNLILDGCTVDRSYGDWALTIFAKNARVSNCAVLGNVAIYEDAFHILGGEQIAVSNCNFSGGDDCIALGWDFQDCFIRDVSVANCTVNSTRAFGLKIFADAAQTSGSTNIERVTFTGITGTAGHQRNGGIFVKEYGTARGAIRDISFSNIQLGVNGAAGSHDGTNPYGIYLDGCKDIWFDGVRVTGNRSHAVYLTALRGRVQFSNCKFDATTLSGSALYVSAAPSGSVTVRGSVLLAASGDPVVRDYEGDLTLSGCLLDGANAYYVSVQQASSSTRILEVESCTFTGTGTIAVISTGSNHTFKRFRFTDNSVPDAVYLGNTIFGSTSFVRHGNRGQITDGDTARAFGRDAVILTGSVTHDFPSISAGASSDVDLTVTGARSGDVALVTSPGFAASLVFQASIPSNDTVRIRAINAGTSPYDHASSPFYVVVVKQ